MNNQIKKSKITLDTQNVQKKIVIKTSAGSTNFSEKRDGNI